MRGTLYILTQIDCIHVRSLNQPSGNKSGMISYTYKCIFLCKIGIMKYLFTAFTIWLFAELYSQQWAADQDSGFDLARSSGRDVLLLFSVTDGCATCEKLEKTIFADPAFLEYASTRYVLVREDFSIVTAQTKSNHLLIVE